MPTIRPARLSDLPAITAIYNDAGVGTTASWALEPVTLEPATVGSPGAAPPSQSYSNTTVLIPVTGADQLATLRTILFNLGLTLLGLGFILKGLSRRS